MAKKTTKATKAKPERPAEKERRQEERREGDEPVVVNRRKVQRRRQIDPTTCERDYTNDEIEFMDAMDAYKRANGRMFPTCSEILEVVRDLGYARVTTPTVVVVSTEGQSTEGNAGEGQVVDELPTAVEPIGMVPSVDDQPAAHSGIHDELSLDN